MPLVANTYHLFVELPAYVAFAALAAFVLLLPLYFSQRRDLHRLREWMERDPDHPGADLAASETLLDRAEAELEAVFGDGATHPDGGGEGPVTPAPVPATTSPALVRPAPAGEPSSATVTAERPALERITMEREALLPHPRWRRLVARVGQPRVLGIVALAAVVLGVAAIFGSEKFLSGGREAGGAPKPGAVTPADVEVRVLNGTSVPGLAAKVGSDVEVNGFNLGPVGNSRQQFDQTVVMYAPGQARAANRVAHDLGVKAVQPIDRQTQGEAAGAEVVVIAGADRARP